MKQPTAILATLITGLALACILTGLAVSTNQKDACDNPTLVCGLNSGPECTLALSLPEKFAGRATPTLAPPRSAAAAVGNSPSSAEVAKGQPVFLNVETDRNEIEVGWASP
jgi:hypothetical protein